MWRRSSSHSRWRRCDRAVAPAKPTPFFVLQPIRARVRPVYCPSSLSRNGPWIMPMRPKFGTKKSAHARCCLRNTKHRKKKELELLGQVAASNVGCLNTSKKAAMKSRCTGNLQRHSRATLLPRQLPTPRPTPETHLSCRQSDMAQAAVAPFHHCPANQGRGLLGLIIIPYTPTCDVIQSN
jgi:hypothetical protein